MSNGNFTPPTTPMTQPLSVLVSAQVMVPELVSQTARWESGIASRLRSNMWPGVYLVTYLEPLIGLKWGYCGFQGGASLALASASGNGQPTPQGSRLKG